MTARQAAGSVPPLRMKKLWEMCHMPMSPLNRGLFPWWNYHAILHVDDKATATWSQSEIIHT